MAEATGKEGMPLSVAIVELYIRGRWKWRTIEMSRHEIDGHENAGHVSGVWIGLHGIDFDLALLPSNRLESLPKSEERRTQSM